MIEEKATVVSTEGRVAWVETQRRTVCGSCSANKGCGTATLSKVLGQKRTQVRVLNEFGARPGENVIIGLEEGAMLKGSLVLYALPLLMLFGGVMFGAVLAEGFGFHYTEGWRIAFALIGLVAGFYAVRRFSNRISDDKRFQAVVLRRDEAVVNFVSRET